MDEREGDVCVCVCVCVCVRACVGVCVRAYVFYQQLQYRHNTDVIKWN